METPTRVSRMRSSSLEITSRAPSFLHMRTVVFKPHRLLRQLVPQEVRHRETGLVDEAAEESMQTATEGEVDTKALGGAEAEAGAALTTEGTLGESHPASGEEARLHPRGNQATGGEEDAKVDADAEEGDGRVKLISQSNTIHP